MIRATPWFLVLAVAGWLTAGSALALTPGVRDGAGLFSPAAVVQADADIRAMATRYHKDLLIETFAGVPAGQVKTFKGLRSKQQKQFQAAWTKKQAESAGIDGVYVLICKDPVYVGIAVAPEAQEAFTESDRKRLYQLLSRRLGGKQNDQALAAAVKLVRDACQTNLHTKKNTAFSWVWLGGTIVGLLGLWMVLGLVQGMVAVRRPLPDDAATRRKVGGGFIPGLVGGMFGAAAGSWLYQALFVEPKNMPPAAMLSATHEYDPWSQDDANPEEYS